MSYLAEYVPASKRGVVFLSSVPRDMRPPEVCLHFNKFGSIQRHRFVPFPKKERRPGGPLLPLQYKEGWIEFSKAKDAKSAAAYMNMQPVDCKRTRKCYGQLWNVKYLEDFSWDTLVEEREGARRARRMAEVDARRQERDANEAYRRLVMQAQQQRRQRRQQRQQQHSQEETDSPSASAREKDAPRGEHKGKAAGARGVASAAAGTVKKAKKAATESVKRVTASPAGGKTRKKRLISKDE